MLENFLEAQDGEDSETEGQLDGEEVPHLDGVDAADSDIDLN